MSKIGAPTVGSVRCRLVTGERREWTAVAMIRVLLVEDNRLLRHGATSILNEQPDIKAISVGTANGEAMSKARTFKPHVVLLDIGLRNVNSLKLVQTMRKDFPKARVIVMDLIPVHRDVVEFVKYGVSGFVFKDATLTEFMRTIRAVASGVKVLPPPLTESLFSQIIEQSLQSGKGKSIIKFVRLTKREQEIVDLIAEGSSNKQMADKLNIAVHTVKSHVHNILEKLALHSRLEVARLALHGDEAEE